MPTMPLFERRERVEIKRVQMAIPTDALELLEKYADYLNLDRGEVLAGVIKHAVQLDAEFCHQNGIASPSTARTGRRSRDGAGPQG